MARSSTLTPVVVWDRAAQAWVPLTRVRGVAFAKSAGQDGQSDGQWEYERQDDTGSTWTVTHVPTGRHTDFWPSLTYCREMTASGAALDILNSSSAPVEAVTR